MDPLALFFYFLQQLGMTLGVGSSTFAVMFYILGMADGRIDPSERAFMRAVFVTLRIGLFLIIMSGAAITGAHYLVGDIAVLMTPVFLFKWALLAMIILTALLMDRRIIPRTVGGTVAGASWYALFVVHTIALDIGWLPLLGLYALWLGLFALAFLSLAKFAQHWYEEHHREDAPAAAAKPPQGPTIEFSLRAKPPETR